LFVFVELLFNLNGQQLAVGIPLAWSAVVATAVAASLKLWQPRARHALGQLYAVGLMALGLGLHHFAVDPASLTWATELSPRSLGWTAGVLLASYVLLTALLGRLVRMPGVPAKSGFWFAPAQASVGCVVIAMSV